MGLSDTKLEKAKALKVAVLLFCTSVLLYSLNINKALRPDELYHILAARGLVETGIPQIAEGRYDRTYYYTAALATLFNWFGESISIARLPSILGVSALVSVMFLWLNRTAGAFSAFSGSILFAISPFAVEVALFIRFYAFQALFFFTGAILCYAAITRSKHRILRIAAAATSTASIGIAAYLQKTTFIGLMGLAMWLVGIGYITCCEKLPRRKGTIKLALAVSAIIVLLLVLGSGIYRELWASFRYVPIWNSPLENAYWFYAVQYLKNYPTLIPASLLLALTAILSRPRPAIFCILIFSTSILASSFAASKGDRYIIYAQPFFFGMIGIGLSAIRKPLTGWLLQSRHKLSNLLPFNHATSNRVANTLFTAAICFIFATNPGFARSAARLKPSAPEINWEASKAILQPYLAEADIVVTLAELEMLYHFDHYDILYSSSRLEEISLDSTDFDLDFRTGMPVIGSLTALTTVMQCHRSGIIVTGSNRWDNPILMPTHVKNYILRNTDIVKLPTKSQVLSFYWGGSTKGQKLDKKKTIDKSICLSIPNYPVP